MLESFGEERNRFKFGATAPKQIQNHANKIKHLQCVPRGVRGLLSRQASIERLSVLSEERHWKWLAAKIPGWIEEGILGSDQAERLLREQPPFRRKRNLLVRILIGISALLFGLGIISFFAFNWQSMPKWLKLTIVLSSFPLAHLAGIILSRIKSREIWSEFSHLLGTLLFGAAIMLIAQIYHIDEHSPNGVLLWSAGALLMAYIIDSTPQLLLSGVLIIVWQFMERSFESPGLWAALSAGAALIPLTVRKKHWFAMLVATSTLAIITAIQLSYHPGQMILGLFFLGCAGMGAGLLLRRTAETTFAKPPEVAGCILYLSLLVVLTFSGNVEEGLIEIFRRAETSDLSLLFILAAANVSVWVSFCFPLHSVLKRYRLAEDKHVFLAFPGFITALAICALSVLDGTEFRDHLALTGMILFNLLAVVHGIVLIFAGTRTGRVGTSFIGSLLVIAIILLRFADYSDDLLVRSASFVIAGAFILWIALRTSKAKKEQDILDHERP